MPVEPGQWWVKRVDLADPARTEWMVAGPTIDGARWVLTSDGGESFLSLGSAELALHYDQVDGTPEP